MPCPTPKSAGPSATGAAADIAGEKSAAEVLAVMPDGIVVVGADTRVTFVNARAERLLGRCASELVGQPVRQALPLVDDTGRPWWDCIDPWGGLATRTGHRERMLLAPGRGHLLVTMSFVRDEHLGPVSRVIVALRDTEARRRAEAGTAELVSLVAHELRSPLSSVKGFSSTLLRRWNRFDDEQKHLMIETIEADADRLARLIHELLDVSRLDSGRLRLHCREVDLGDALSRHISRLVAAGNDRDRFAWEAPSEPVLAWGDPDRLDQVIANLLENALRHGDGRVTVSLCAGGPSGAPEGATVEVADQGPGVPPHQRALVFQKFWHGSRRGSTGLGLYLVRGIVEAHGGVVGLQEAPGGGAAFRVSLPPRPPGSAAEPPDITVTRPG